VFTTILLFLLLVALETVDVALVDVVAHSHGGEHDNGEHHEDTRALVKAGLVVARLPIVLLAMLKELDRLFG